MSQPIVTPIPAATVLLIRQANKGIEVFLQRRNPKATFVGGAYVFPGGKVDQQDQEFPQELLSHALNDSETLLEHIKPLSIQGGGLPSVVAALREAFEEAGILLAYDEHNRLLEVTSKEMQSRFHQYRLKLYQGELEFASILRQESLKLAIDQLVYMSHWITPEGSPQRFDTRFFITQMPPHQCGDHDGYESVDSIWLSPDEALEKYNNHEIQLILPTVITLQEIKEHQTVQESIDYFYKTSHKKSKEARGLTLNGQFEVILDSSS